MTETTSPAISTLPTAAHRLAMVLPFIFSRGKADAKLDAQLDALVLQAGLTVPAGVEAAGLATEMRWRPYAGANNDMTDANIPGASGVDSRNPAYDSLYPVAQQAVQNALHPLDQRHPVGTHDTLRCLPYSLPLAGCQLVSATKDGEKSEAAVVRLHSARLVLFRTGIGLLLLLLEVGEPGELPVGQLLDALRGLSEPHAAPGNRYAALSPRLDKLAGELLAQTLAQPIQVRTYPQRKTWVAAAQVPSAAPQDLQRLALLLSHRQTPTYALQPEYVHAATYAPFAYTAHAASIGGAASVVGSNPGAQRFVDLFIDRVWSHTYLPLLLLPLHQHYFYLRHAEWEPMNAASGHAVHALEKRYAQAVELQAHFGSTLVGQIDLHNAYVQMVEQRLRLGEREREFERATRDYSDMLRAQRLSRLRVMEIAGSFAAVFIVVRELFEAAMQNGFFGFVPESRAWFALLQRWTPEQITEMIERIHHWEQATFAASIAAGLAAAGIAAWAGRRIGKE